MIERVFAGGLITLRLGSYDEALVDVDACSLLGDPPYSDRTHAGHDAGTHLGWEKPSGGVERTVRRRELSYARWGSDEMAAFAEFWAPRTTGWSVILSDSEQTSEWRRLMEAQGRTGFQPLPCVIPGMTVRLAGDGPSSWAFYANVSRPKALSKWGTLPGAYYGNQGEREHIGGKPLWLMRALVRQYTKPGDLVCDPVAGGATTLIAAALEGRRAIGSEVDRATYDLACARLERTPITPPLFTDERPAPKQEALF